MYGSSKSLPPRSIGLRPKDCSRMDSPMSTASRVSRKICIEKVQLLFSFDSAAIAYSRAVGLLKKRAVEFRHEKDWRAVDECCRRVDEARQALIRHMSEHEC